MHSHADSEPYDHAMGKILSLSRPPVPRAWAILLYALLSICLSSIASAHIGVSDAERVFHFLVVLLFLLSQIAARTPA